jgi:hypothetical protein
MSESKKQDLQVDRFQRIALITGIIAAVLSMVGIFFGSPGQFFHSYLFAYLFWLGISLGSLAGVMLHNLVGGNWGLVIRRPMEAAAKTVWLMAILFLPLIAGIPHLFSWANPETVAADPLLQLKIPYLNIPFFILRAILYFATWSVLMARLTRWSRQLEVFTDPLLRRRFQRVSAFGLILYFLTMTFASVDWLMSLQPVWISTIYGMLIIMEQLLSGLAFAILFLPFLLARHAALREAVTPGHIRDLGAFLLTAVILWAYLAFFQYLIIWSGNLPREVIWYILRFSGGWLYVGLFIVILQFGLPFIILLSSQTKQNPRVLAGLGLVILAGNLANYFWQVAPVFKPARFSIHWLDLSVTVAIGGLWFAVFTWMLNRTPQTLYPETQAQTRMEKAIEHETRQSTARG